jgi:hypothetical protein
LGSGAQYATYAIGEIFDFATAQNNNGGASTPTGLSFANTSGFTDTANGNFGGSLGAASGCMPDYYASKPSSFNAWPSNVSSMTTGAYQAPSAKTVLAGGNVNPGNKIAVYVDGDVFISSNITYTPNWSYGNIPLFRLIVRGNIYISKDVTRLDGIYTAQPDTSGNGGGIYTCADPANITTQFQPKSTGDNNFYSTCNTQLTVNGAFAASHIDLMRTHGSLRDSTAGETGGSSNAGEVFNYGPAFWLAQPQGTSGLPPYDSISSLPPIL